MVLGKRWILLIGNGAKVWPIEKGRKCPENMDVNDNTNRDEDH